MLYIQRNVGFMLQFVIQSNNEDGTAGSSHIPLNYVHCVVFLKEFRDSGYKHCTNAGQSDTTKFPKNDQKIYILQCTLHNIVALTGKCKQKC